MQKILSRFSFTEKDEKRKPISKETWVRLETSPGRYVYQVESYEGPEAVGQPNESEEDQPVGLNFNLPASTMTKPEFRANIRWGIAHDVDNPSGGVDLDKLDMAILKTNRGSRKKYGGLVYNPETIQIALSIYKTL